MFITGLGTATPPHRYAQAQCWEAFQAAPQFALLDRRARTTLQRVLLRDNGIRTRSLALDLVGQGCGAAIPNLRAAGALLRTDDCRKVLSICVEVCSAAFYLDNDPGVLISACLFGDGAGAAVLAAAPKPAARRIEWKATGSFHDPAERDVLRFEHQDGMLRNIL